MKYTAVYMRVSTDNGQKFDSQRDELKQWIAQHKPTNVKWYQDKFTGTSMARPGMQRIMDELGAGKLESIVCWRLDRLGRTASGLTKLFEDLRLYNCNLISIKDNLDLSTPAGRLNANIIASVAAYETEVRAERVKAGQAAARNKGKRWGGSERGQRKRKIADKVSAVLKLHSQGASKAEISRAVGISLPTVYSIVKKG